MAEPLSEFISRKDAKTPRKTANLSKNLDRNMFEGNGEMGLRPLIPYFCAFASLRDTIQARPRQKAQQTGLGRNLSR
jgi:hypothetical protein